jgi:molecular chaperone GrpE
MSEESVKHIHIDGADEEKKQSAAEEAEAAEAAAESEEAVKEPEENGTETADEAASEESGDEAAKEEADEKTAEEQESERYMRLMAEFQNFKRRAAKEKSDIHAFANERIVSDLLPVLDNFERALGTQTEDVEYAKGMDLIFQQLKAALDKAGLKEIEAEDKEFDPNVHNAVMTESIEDKEDGIITKVLQKGYKLNDKVVRPSMVAVNKK